MRTLIVTLSALLLVAGLCSRCRTGMENRGPEAKTERPKRTNVAARRASAQGPKAEKIGREAIARLRRTLGKHLRQAMKAGGPVAALEVCSHKAQNLTAEVNRALPQGVTIKRTSARVRNPANAPTPEESSVLRWFASHHGKSGAPRFKSSVQDPGLGKPAVYHYYEPITVIGVCTRCHGPKDTLAPQIKSIVAKRYPKDAATGYKSGDLRGMFHVTIPEAALR